MFEKLRIKEHMEIVTAAGQHVGTVDEVDGDTIKLTRTDSSDGQHHYVDFDTVDRIDENRIYLKEGAPAPAPRVAGGQFAAGTQRQYSDGQEFGTGQRIDPNSYSSERPGAGTGSGATSADQPLFGTSGLGTGVGGSGPGEH